jgi:hypothetical protein
VNTKKQLLVMDLHLNSTNDPVGLEPSKNLKKNIVVSFSAFRHTGSHVAELADCWEVKVKVKWI